MSLCAVLQGGNRPAFWGRRPSAKRRAGFLPAKKQFALHALKLLRLHTPDECELWDLYAHCEAVLLGESVQLPTAPSILAVASVHLAFDRSCADLRWIVRIALQLY